MPKYVIKIEQEFIVNASSEKEAYFLLPSYGWSPNPQWEMTASNTELIGIK